MSDISITTRDGKTTLAAPYHPNLPKAARNLGGQFGRGTRSWTFDARDEARVRDLAIEIYGTDGSDADDTVTVRISVDSGTWESGTREALYCGSREIARAWGRDSGAKLSEGVVLLEGRVRSAGSVKNWDTRADEGTIVEVRDVPRGIANKMLEEAEGHYRISAEIVESGEVDVEALRAERERLVARIAEIDAQLVDHA